VVGAFYGEVPLYLKVPETRRMGSLEGAFLASEVQGSLAITGYLAHKKANPPRTLL